MEAEQTIAALREQLAGQGGGGVEVAQGRGQGSGGGPKVKAWDQIGPSQKKRCTGAIDAQLEDLALARGTEPHKIAANIVKRCIAALYCTALSFIELPFFYCLRNKINIFCFSNLHCTALHCRKTHMTDKVTAATAAKIEAGERLEGVKKMSLETASWMVTRGEGMGKMMYR